MKQKPGVMIYFDLRPVLDLLSMEEKGMLFQAILEYGEDGFYTHLDEKLSLLWPLIQQRLDRDWARYQATVLKRRYAAYSRWEKQHGHDPLPYVRWAENHTEDTDYEEEDPALACTECQL